MNNSLFLWIEENGSRSCPWSFRVVIAILFPLLTLQEQIRFDLYNLRNWNWKASKLYRIKKRFLERNSSIPSFYGRRKRFSIALCLLFYPTFQIFPLVLHILFSNHKPVDFPIVLFFRTQNTSKVKGNEEPRVEMDRRRSTAGRMREATVSWSLLSPRGRSIISRQLSLTESRRENEFYDTRFPPPINDTFLLATSPDRKSQIKPRDLL